MNLFKYMRFYLGSSLPEGLRRNKCSRTGEVVLCANKAKNTGIVGAMARLFNKVSVQKNTPEWNICFYASPEVRVATLRGSLFARCCARLPVVVPLHIACPKKYSIFGLLILFLMGGNVIAQDFRDIAIESDITEVQPMTGIVFWDGDNTNTDAISLEYSYMLYKDMVDLDGNFVWDKVEEKLNDIASRDHQAILRFRYTYVGQSTAVPQYIKNLPDYNETLGLSEGEDTWFPDWSHPELQAFNTRFYQAYAEKYDGDPRLAFVQTGFGLWAEYHIYDGPFTLGGTFPSMDYQQQFFYHLDTIFKTTPWSISIDAADGTYAPFEDHPALLNIKFGNFDDSFMAQEHPYVNALNWAFFEGNDRYRYSPAGGEFSYYTDWDQRHVLDLPDGAHGISYEASARNFGITYMIGNDQPGYQTMDRIKQASLASGYKFQIVRFQTAAGLSKVEVKNVGIAPFYYPAYVVVNGTRSATSLQGLLPGETIECEVNAGAAPNEQDPVLTIESDYILDGQHIDFYGTTFVGTDDPVKYPLQAKIYPTLLGDDHLLNIELLEEQQAQVNIYNTAGLPVFEAVVFGGKSTLKLPLLSTGIYFVRLQSARKSTVKRLLVSSP